MRRTLVFLSIFLLTLVAVRGVSAVLRVRDHGPGVPEADLARIFEPFYRVLRPDSRVTDGTGIGLAIAARAARLHGAQIRATNAPGGGLEVSIVFETSGSSRA